jgi:hypothetical protein
LSQGPQKIITAWSYGFEVGSRAAEDFTFLQAGGPERNFKSEMNAKCKQQHSLSAGALLLASKPSIQVDNVFLRF